MTKRPWPRLIIRPIIASALALSIQPSDKAAAACEYFQPAWCEGFLGCVCVPVSPEPGKRQGVKDCGPMPCGEEGNCAGDVLCELLIS